jgi:hypothetical protein
MRWGTIFLPTVTDQERKEFGDTPGTVQVLRDITLEVYFPTGAAVAQSLQ